MKSMRTLFLLVISITSVIANDMDTVTENNSALLLNIGKYITLELSLTPNENNENFLHNLVECEKFFNNEKSEFSMTLNMKLGLAKKEENEGITRVPYSKHAEPKARNKYRKHTFEQTIDDTIESLSNIVLKLLSQKNNDGKTPIDLLREKDADSAQAIEEDIKLLQDSAKKQEFKNDIKLRLLQQLF